MATSRDPARGCTKWHRGCDLGHSDEAGHRASLNAIALLGVSSLDLGRTTCRVRPSLCAEFDRHSIQVESRHATITTAFGAIGVRQNL